VNKREQLAQFLKRFGSPVVSADGKHQGFGVLAPLKEKDTGKDDVIFGKYGFRPKRDLVLLLSAESRWVLPGCEVRMEEKRFHIHAVDDIYFKGKVFYRAAYGFEAKGVNDWK